MIRTAVVGFGLAGSVFHAPALEANPDFELSAIVTASTARRAQAAVSHPAARLVESFRELPFDDLDLLILATPPGTHVPLGHAALDAGLAVVVDKPFAPSSAEALDLIDHANTVGALLTVYQNRRWDGEFQTVQGLLAEKAFGEVLRFESRMERWAPQISKPWKAQAGPGNGILFDLGTHLIDQALQLFGPVQRVYGELDIRREQEQNDDDVFIALQHHSGVRSHLGMNLLSAQFAPRMRVLGTEAAYLKAHGDLQEAQIQAGILPGSQEYGLDPKWNWGMLGRGAGLQPVKTVRGNYPRFYELLATAINESGPPPVDPADAVAALRIIEEIRAQNSR